MAAPSLLDAARAGHKATCWHCRRVRRVTLVGVVGKDLAYLCRACAPRPELLRAAVERVRGKR